MPEYRMKVAPDTVAYADSDNRKLAVEFAIPGAPADTVDVKVVIKTGGAETKTKRIEG